MPNQPPFPPGNVSQKLLSDLKTLIASPNYTGLYGISIRKGKGCYFTDYDGFRYLDGLAGASTNCLGFGHKAIVKAYTRAARTMQHSCFVYSPNAPALKLAKKLISITPGTFDKKVAFGISGSDGCDGAIKAMRKYTGILGIVHFKNDYHGSTGLSMPASDFGHLNDKIFDKNNLYIELDFPTTPEKATEILQKIESLLAEKKVGGILAEAIQGDAGIKFAPLDFFSNLKALTQKYHAVLAIDEVQSGMGRTGKWWAIEHYGVEPDLLITGKSLSGGFAPISAIIGRTDVLNSLEHGQHLFTFAGHAPSSAAALEVIKTIERENLKQNARKMGALILDGLTSLKSKFPTIIKDVRGIGLMIGMEVFQTKTPLSGKIFATRCVELGAYVGFFGVDAEVIRIEPPLIISAKEVKKLLSVIEEVLNECQSDKIPEATLENVKKYSIGL